MSDCINIKPQYINLQWKCCIIHMKTLKCVEDCRLLKAFVSDYSTTLVCLVVCPKVNSTSAANCANRDGGLNFSQYGLSR